MSMTPRQKQGIMALAVDSDGNFYYNDKLDGLWGPKSQAAAERFIQDFIREDSKEKPEDNTDSFWDEIEYFDREEFRCPCNKCNGFPVEPKENLVRAVDEMRREFRSPVIVVPPDGHSGGSGVRCQAYNDSLPGSVANSRHVQGKAADFSAPGVPASTIEAYLAKIKANGTIRYWYKIGTGSYHMDVA